MDLKEAIRDIAKRSRVARDTAETEEATKNAVIMPLIRTLGFDVFDLNQVIPEFTSDVGTKKGEKVDYALKIKDQICILVEAKPISVDLGQAQYNQLFRYFSVTEARIAMLTNGQQIWFFTDIDEVNKMDKKPFFTFDLESYDDDDLKELSKFHRDKFDINLILETAATLKYTNSAAIILSEQISAPDDELVKFIGRQIYDGNMTKSVVEQLRPTIRAAFAQIIRDKVQERLDRALAPSDEESAADTAQSAQKIEEKPEIETTEEEWQAFYIVRAIASEKLDPIRIGIRDSKSYCSVLVDDSNRKPVCRLYFNSKSVKYIGLFDREKKEEKVRIEAPHDIFQFRAKIHEALDRYMQ